MTEPFFEQVKAGPMENFLYLFGAGGKCAIVDPGFEAERLVRAARERGMEVTHVVVTHAHYDHVQELPRVRELTGAKVVAHPASPVNPDVPVGDGEEVDVAGVRVKALYTPGHEPTAVTFVVADRWLLTGDTLFIDECGRTDLPGSDPAAMWDSLLNRLARLPGDLVVAPGHDYGPTPTDTLARQLESNYTLRPRSREEFVRFMREP